MGGSRTHPRGGSVIDGPTEGVAGRSDLPPGAAADDVAGAPPGLDMACRRPSPEGGPDQAKAWPAGPVAGGGTAAHAKTAIVGDLSRRAVASADPRWPARRALGLILFTSFLLWGMILALALVLSRQA